MLNRISNILSYDLFNVIFCNLIGEKISKFKKGDTVSAFLNNKRTKGIVDTIKIKKDINSISPTNSDNFVYEIISKDYVLSIDIKENDLVYCRMNLIEKIKSKRSVS